ncbi:MAG: DUF1592 domain-containing protein [Opitutales bacterium]
MTPFVGLAEAPSVPPARELLQTYCTGCHSTLEQKANFDLEALSRQAVRQHPKAWQEVADVVDFEEMPPLDEPQPSIEERQKIVAWIEAELEQSQSGFFAGPSIPRRLNRDEFAYTLYDLTGVKLDIASLLPDENIINFGFDTIAEDLDFTPAHLENYSLVADLAIEKLFSTDPTAVTPAIQDARSKYFATWPGPLVSDQRSVEANIFRFAAHAYRRQLSERERQIFSILASLELENGASAVEALKTCVKAVLLSPQFLYRIEDVPLGGEAQEISDLELASRLSYFLWSSMPDSELLTLAADGKLKETETLREQLLRMLRDPKAERFAARFTEQWLFFELEDHVPDPAKFPYFDKAVDKAAHAELQIFFHQLFAEGRSLREIIDADYVFVNESLAAVYGIDGVSGDELRKVAVDDRRRGGMLGMSAILKRTSMASRTSPTKRGQWVLNALFGTPPPPPPDAIEPIDETTSSDESGRILSFREKLEMHSQPGSSCAGCHKKMDPFGFAMDRFNAVGRWREKEGPREIDTQATLPNGDSLDGVVSLKKHLLSREDDIIRNVAERLMIYALGRGLTPDEYLEVRKIVSDMSKKAYPADELLFQLVNSQTFQLKRGPVKTAFAEPQ